MTQPDDGNRPLWAPWRMAYIRRTTDGEEPCFLCAKGRDAGTDEADYVIARGRTCYVLLNEFPYNPGHLLVAPLRHVPDIAALTAAEQGELMALMITARTALGAAMQPHGFNVGCNLGRTAGAAVVDHVHWHVVPRWNGDTNFMPVLAKTDCLPMALAEAAKAVRQHWPSPPA